jgi:hypothetical protein
LQDAHRGDRNRFIVRADQKLSALLELERALCIHLLSKTIKTRLRFWNSNQRFALVTEFV